MYIDRTAFEQYTIAFYNVENLFHPSNEKWTLDDDYTPGGKRQWTDTRYRRKLKKLASVIVKIGRMQTGKPPSIIGLAEVESSQVLEDLLRQAALKDEGYGYVHFDSPDERGIDTALLYRKNDFELQNKTQIPLSVYEGSGIKDDTRDILEVKGFLKGMAITLYVNHWPSRRDGGNTTNHKRVAAAKQLMDYIQKESGSCKNHQIIMGDFNDDPENQSIREGILPYGYENVTAKLKTARRGSLNYRFRWNLFDQMIVSNSLLQEHSDNLYFYQSDIFDDIMLKQWKGKYRGQPARTFVGSRYKGGLSDHFPVFSIFRVH